MSEGRSIPHLRDIFGVDSGAAVPKEKECLRKETLPVVKKGVEDARHLERHLSMKKTIRKKIMRELQQAFVEDPDQFMGSDGGGGGHPAPVEDKVAITFGKGGNFLDFLRTGEVDSGRKSPTRESSANQGQDKQGFWRRFAFRRNKR